MSVRGSRLNKRAKAGIVLGSLVLLVIAGFLLFKVLQRRWEEILRANRAYTTSGTVMEKKKFVITSEDPYYISDLGDRIPEIPGTEQWRIYYEIDNFDQVPEPKRTELMQAEVRRLNERGMRFYPFYAQEKEFYDRTEVGDKLVVRYQYVGREKDIINIENLTHPRKN